MDCTRRVLCALLFTALAAAAGAVGSESGAPAKSSNAVAPEVAASISAGAAVAPRGVKPVPPPASDLRAWVWLDDDSYDIGDRIRIRFRTNQPAYVYIFADDPSGITRQVFPNYYDQDNFVRGNTRYYIPDSNYSLQVTGPPGRNTLTIVAVRENYPFLREWRRFSSGDPYPRVGGTSAFKQQMRSAPSPRGVSVQGVQPVPADSGYAEDSTSFRVRRGSEPRPPRYSGGVEIDTRPPNASIYLDGTYMGRTPKVLENLRPGNYTVRLTKKGYHDYRHDLTIRQGEVRSYTIDLDR